MGHKLNLRGAGQFCPGAHAHNHLGLISSRLKRERELERARFDDHDLTRLPFSRRAVREPLPYFDSQGAEGQRIHRGKSQRAVIS